MHFEGSFELEGSDTETVWLALSDPVLVQNALPGCSFLLEVSDSDPDFEKLRDQSEELGREITDNPEAIAERAFEESGQYAALMEVGVGAVKPSFKTVVTISEREFPSMTAEGTGDASNSSFDMDAWMELSESDDGVVVEWSADADVFGRVAQMGQRMINPVTNRLVKRFFGNLQEELNQFGVEETDSVASDEGLTSGIRSRLGL